MTITTLIISVLIIAAIGAVLAALLVIAEFFLANYGQCKITINDEKELTVTGGASLLSTLNAEKIFIPSACGGRGTCAMCKLQVLDGAGSALPTEEPYLDKTELAENVRLSCQVKVRNDLKIQIPEELFAVKEYTATCSEIRDLTHDIKLFRFELIKPDSIEFVPGQYMQLLAPKYAKSKEEVYRAYSTASDPAEKNFIEMIIRLVPGGICTTYCFEYLKVGDTVKMTGPYGDFQLQDSDAEMIFIAGGSGMAPFVSILHQMKNQGIGRKATYYFGANLVKELFYLDEMKRFEEVLPNFRFVPVVYKPGEDESWNGETGLVTEAVQRNFSDASNCQGYLCGSPGMIDASIKVLKQLGMKESQVYYDKFA